MKCIVPLAGPDLWTEKFGLRPLYKVKGEAILKLVLKTRGWHSKIAPEDYIFVVRDISMISQLRDFLKVEWPGCMIVQLPCLTGGALFSAMAGVSILNSNEPFIVDLADISFSDSIDFGLLESKAGMIVPVFTSSSPTYSYLKIENETVILALEKSVISSNASAGVYAFRNQNVFISAALHSITNSNTLSYKGNLFVCPMINGVIASGLGVVATHLCSVTSFGDIFKM